jgi:hypothetical protein
MAWVHRQRAQATLESQLAIVSERLRLRKHLLCNHMSCPIRQGFERRESGRMTLGVRAGSGPSAFKQSAFRFDLIGS